MDCIRFRLFDEDAGWMVLFLWRSINVYKAVVLTTLLYGAESYGSPIVAIYMHLIERYHQRCLRAILNIHWSDFVTNIEVLEMAKINQHRGHAPQKHSFAGQDISPGWKIIAYQRSELSTGHRDKGTPQKIYEVNHMNWRRT